MMLFLRSTLLVYWKYVQYNLLSLALLLDMHFFRVVNDIAIVVGWRVAGREQLVE
jgi:hypothetical protein